jgi:hypothetical protein
VVHPVNFIAAGFALNPAILLNQSFDHRSELICLVGWILDHQSLVKQKAATAHRVYSMLFIIAQVFCLFQALPKALLDPIKPAPKISGHYLDLPGDFLGVPVHRLQELRKVKELVGNNAGTDITQTKTNYTKGMGGLLRVKWTIVASDDVLAFFRCALQMPSRVKDYKPYRRSNLGHQVHRCHEATLATEMLHQ